MKKYINEYGKECYRDVNYSDNFNCLEFYKVKEEYESNDIQYALHTNLGSLTVLDRLTGYEGYIRDIETGFRDNEGKFWLASGGYDVRHSGAETIKEAIDWVKKNANTCIGI